MHPSLVITDDTTNHGIPAASVGEHRTIVWRYLRALGASRNEADDLAQETMLASLGATIDTAQNHQSFLLGVARNQWLRSRRWWQRRREREIADAVEHLWQATVQHDGGDARIEQLRDCLEHLQPRTQQALDLHYREQLAWPEVAKRIGMKPNGIKTLAQRARQALRDCLERKSS